MIEAIKAYFERQAFGVCQWWGNKLGIDSGRIRLYFIYTSFVTLGSPIIAYLIMAFVLEHKDWFKRRKRTVWDL